MQNFRNITKNEDILNLIRQAPDSNKGELWQTQPDIRLHYKISNLKDDVNNKAIVFETNTPYKFSSKYPVYVRINHRDLIFKLTARSFVVSGNKLACVYPNLAKAIEKRGCDRIPLPDKRETSIVLRPLGAGAQELRVKLLDISKKGIGISISEMNRDYLLRNGLFKITEINHVKLVGDHQLDIRYVERMGKGVVKSGCHLRTPFKDDIFDLICKIIFGA